MLGEEQSATGAVRYVDSSVERVQARVSGWVDERYVLSANGAAVPLTHTDREGEYVGGVRFKAWNPPSSLHPTIGVHAPLVLDVYDRWSERSVAGLDPSHLASWWATASETLPLVNANEVPVLAPRAGSSRLAAHPWPNKWRNWRGATLTLTPPHPRL